MIAQHMDTIALVRSALNGEPVQISAEFNWEELKRMARVHQVGGLLCEGLWRSGAAVPADVSAYFKQSAAQYAMLDARQMSEVAKVTAAFERAGIDYMPLKGIRMKKLYPNSLMRTMSDADILIKTAQYEKIRSIMLDLGYVEGKESDHELVWDKPGFLNLELHKRLVPSNNEDYFDYYGDGWQLAQPESGHCYAMSKEDEFIFLFTHFAKHYRDGGIGVRHLADLYIYLRTYPELDEGYIQKELTALRLDDFYRNIRGVINAWFADGAWDEKTQFISTHILNSGAYGTHEWQVLSAVVAEYEKKENSVAGARFLRFWKLTFPPLSVMKQKYAVLKKYPVLLPLCWCVRIIDVLFLTKGKWAHHTRDLKNTSAENVKLYQTGLRYVGLDFKFKER